MLLAAMYCCAVARTEIVSYGRIHAQLRALQLQQRALAVRHEQLLSAVARARTPDFVAAAARQELGYVGTGQVPLAPIEPDTTVGGGGTSSAAHGG